MVDFELEHTHMPFDEVQKATTGEHVVTKGPEAYYNAEPAECVDCTELELRIASLEAELSALNRERLQGRLPLVNIDSSSRRDYDIFGN